MPKKTIETIISSENHYVVQVKRNQLSLFNEITSCLSQQLPLDAFETKEKGHGRHSYWQCSVFNAKGSDKSKEWKGLARFVHIKKITFNTKTQKTSESDRLYMTDLETHCAKSFCEGIRGHWAIENSLHWVKDVIHKEDINRIRKGNGPINMAIISAISINIHRKNGAHSITHAQVEAAANIKKTILTQLGYYKI